uniref:Uncharacterized protein n=1 Tax=Octopus bimaculoides TaxID=37653 RepID=A0A0L8GCM5_OCTBM
MLWCSMMNKHRPQMQIHTKLGRRRQIGRTHPTSFSKKSFGEYSKIFKKKKKEK